MGELLTKDFPLEIKKLSDDGDFEGLASAFAKDLVGDTIRPGAFLRTINDARSTKRNIPVLWQHDFSQPIGKILPEDMAENSKGLKVKGKLLLDLGKAQEARTLAQEGVLGGMSIGFEIPKGKSKWSDDFKERDIFEVKLWEVSFVTFPANPKARISGVKGAFSEEELEPLFQMMRDYRITPKRLSDYVLNLNGKTAADDVVKEFTESLQDALQGKTRSQVDPSGAGCGGATDSGSTDSEALGALKTLLNAMESRNGSKHT